MTKNRLSKCVGRCIAVQIPFWLCTLSVFAQNQSTLSGYVRDASSGEVLIGANIFIKERSSGAATNTYGFYSLSLPPGTYTATFSYLGYTSVTRTLELGRDQKLDISLSPSEATLDGIEVTAEAEDQNVESVEMSVASLDVKTIQQIPVVLGESDVIKSIQLLPGVTSVSEGTSSFNVRGGSGDQNLIMLDESPIYNAAHLFGFFSVFNSDAIKDVKLYKGGIPAQYGGRLSSVLDVRQRDGNMKRYALSGGLGTLSSKLLFEGPIRRDQGSFLIAGRRSYADLFFPLFNELNNSAAYFYDLNVKANYALNDHNRIYFSGYIGRDRLKFGSAFGMQWGNTAFTGRWNHLFSNRLFSNFVLSHSNYQYALDFSTSESSAFNWTSHILNYNLKADFSFFINDRITLHFGSNSIFYTFKPGEVKPIGTSSVIPSKLDDKFALEPATYLSYEQKIGSRLSIQAGLRLSTFLRMGAQTINAYANNQPAFYNSQLGRYENGVVVDSTVYTGGETIKSFFGLEPRFSARYALSGASSVKASYNRTRQYIHLISNTTTPTPLDVWVPSGPFIDPITADQVALGYFRNFGSNAYEASIEAYYKTMRNQVDYVDGAELVANNNIETELLSGDGRSYGLEFLLRKKKGSLTGWLSYTLSRSELRVQGVGEDPGINNGDYYPSNYDKPHNLSLVMAYRLSPKWSFSANFIYATGRPVTYPVSRYEINGVSVTNYENRNQARVPASHRLDVSITLNDALGGDWTLGIYNVYNRKNPYSITFRPTQANPSVSEAVRLSIFSMVPSLTYSFKL